MGGENDLGKLSKIVQLYIYTLPLQSVEVCQWSFQSLSLQLRFFVIDTQANQFFSSNPDLPVLNIKGGYKHNVHQLTTFSIQFFLFLKRRKIRQNLH